MRHRVRAVLLTPTNTLLLMRRIRPGVEPYSVVVGGKVEATDAGPEAAVLREVHEETGGEATVVRLFHTLETDGERQDFYLATIEEWDFEARTGPEFSQEGRGEYLLQELPLTVEAIGGANLMPSEIAVVLREGVERGGLL
ncbi:NUDIX domain-containing protein [Streptomyces sp. S6]